MDTKGTTFLSASVDSPHHNYKPPLLTGWLKKQGDNIPRTWKKRYFKQDSNNHLLYYYHSNSDISNSLGVIDLKKNVRLEDHSGGTFHLIVEKRTYRLQVLKEEEKGEWTEGIQKWIDYYDMLSSKMWTTANMITRGESDHDLSYSSIHSDNESVSSRSSMRLDDEDSSTKGDSADAKTLEEGVRKERESEKKEVKKREKSKSQEELVVVDLFKLSTSESLYAAAGSKKPTKPKKKEDIEIRLTADTPNQTEIQVDFNAGKILEDEHSSSTIHIKDRKSMRSEKSMRPRSVMNVEREPIDYKQLLKQFEEEFENSDLKKKHQTADEKKGKKMSGSMAKFGKISFQWAQNKFLLFWFGLSGIVLSYCLLPLGFFMGLFCGFFLFVMGFVYFVTFFLGKGKHTGENLAGFFPELVDFSDQTDYNLYRVKYASLKRILEEKTNFDDELTNHDWFNLLFDRFFREHTHNKAFMDRYIEKMNMKLQLSKRPGYIGKITVDCIDFGENSIKIVDRIHMLPPKREGEQRTEFYIEYTGNSPPKITMSVEIFINWPTERFATVVISVRVAINYLSGRVCFVMPPGEDPTCTLAFTTDPVSSFTAESLIGNRTKFQNIPKVSSFLVKKLQTFLRKEMMEPNGITFHIPIKGQRHLKPLLLTKWRKRFGVVDPEAQPECGEGYKRKEESSTHGETGGSHSPRPRTATDHSSQNELKKKEIHEVKKDKNWEKEEKRESKLECDLPE